MLETLHGNARIYNRPFKLLFDAPCNFFNVIFFYITPKNVEEPESAKTTIFDPFLQGD